MVPSFLSDCDVDFYLLIAMYLYDLFLLFNQKILSSVRLMLAFNVSIGLFDSKLDSLLVIT